MKQASGKLREQQSQERAMSGLGVGGRQQDEPAIRSLDEAKQQQGQEWGQTGPVVL
jgi:hypothetical protein